ncbi:hypothetical protein BDV11DRAFT_175409 [Aspergillus similis]
MHLTILSDKIPTLTDAQFRHEFQVVHAEQTKSIAQSLGIIHEYVQGLALTTVNKPPLDRAALDPLKEGSPYQSFARLTWPSLEVMQGSFTTDGYRRSAGGHIFAQPFRIFLTEPVNTMAAQQSVEAVETSANEKIRVIIPIVRSGDVTEPGDDAEFEARWAEHALFVASIGVEYSRHRTIAVSQDSLVRIFDGTPFDHRLVVSRGGYDELVFPSHNAAEAFFRQYSSRLQSSYQRFMRLEGIMLFVYDSTVQVGTGDRGWRQVVAGTFVGIALRLKVWLAV